MGAITSMIIGGIGAIGSAIGTGASAVATGVGAVGSAVGTGVGAVGSAVGGYGTLIGAGLMGANALMGSKSDGGGGSVTAPSVPSTSDAESIAKAELDAKRRAVARNTSIFTSATGLSDEEKSDKSLKTLLGE